MMTTTATTQKIPTYTPEQTLEIVTRYKNGETVETLATAFGKTTKSMVAKLSREKVYQTKTKVAAPTVRKAELISRIAQALGKDEELLESLEKATKEALEIIADGVCRVAAVKGQEKLS